MAASYDDICKLGAELWAVSPQNQAMNQALRERRDLPFPILADAEQAVIREWGIFNYRDPKGRPIPHPATFIIGQDGTIAWDHIGLSTRDRPTVDQIISALELTLGIGAEK